MGIGGGGKDQRAGTSQNKPLDDLVDVRGRGFVARGSISVKIPADGLGSEHVTFEAKLGFSNRNLLLVVEPGGGDVAFACEHEHLDHGKTAADGIFVQ